MPVPADAALVPQDVPNRIDLLPNHDDWLADTRPGPISHHEHYLRLAAELKALGRTRLSVTS